MPLSWKNFERPLSPENLFDLFGNRIATIRVRAFLDANERFKLRNALDAVGFKKYAYDFNEANAPEALHVFDTHYLYESQSHAAYQESVARSQKIYQEVVAAIGFDPVARLYSLLSASCKVKVASAKEENFSYFPCIARELNNSVLLHADFAPFLEGNWNIRHIISELAWNIFLGESVEGGLCQIYNRPWILPDNEHIVQQTYGYSETLVKESQLFLAEPVAGDLVLFNSRNFHSVTSVTKGRRIALGGHLGLEADGSIIGWS